MKKEIRKSRKSFPKIMKFWNPWKRKEKKKENLKRSKNISYNNIRSRRENLTGLISKHVFLIIYLSNYIVNNLLNLALSFWFLIPLKYFKIGFQIYRDIKIILYTFQNFWNFCTRFIFVKKVLFIRLTYLLTF